MAARLEKALPSRREWYYLCMIPEGMRSLFWDINIDGFKPQNYPEYTILRVLEFGDPAAVSWLLGAFSEKVIESVIRNDRRLSRKSANFWALAYKLPQEEVAALREQPDGERPDRWNEGYGAV